MNIITPLLLNIGLAVLSLIIITISAGYIITAVSHYAKKTGVSDYVIGFLVVAMGTSLPELTTAIVASSTNASSLVLGDLIGASILDVTVVLGMTAIIGKKIFVRGKVIEKTLFTIMIMVMLPLLLGFDGQLSQMDGFILITAFILYIFSLLRKEGRFGTLKKQLEWKEIWQDMFVIAGCVAALLLSANWFIRSILAIAVTAQIPEFVMGLVFAGFMTTFPELTVEIRSVLKGITGIAFGDILGSVVMNTTLIMGIAAVINPIKIDTTSFITSAFFLITSVYIALLFIKKKQITWQEGLGVLMLYVTFLVTEGLAGLF